jgi:hypothetical protein
MLSEKEIFLILNFSKIQKPGIDNFDSDLKK